MFALTPISTLSRSNHILIVEDDRGIAGMLVQMVRENGCDASVATSAHKMDELMGKQEFDLVVLDAMLPGEDGFSICRRLRASSTIPILMLTALSEDVDRIIGLELGADGLCDQTVQLPRVDGTNQRLATQGLQ